MQPRPNTWSHNCIGDLLSGDDAFAARRVLDFLPPQLLGRTVPSIPALTHTTARYNMQVPRIDILSLLVALSQSSD